VSVVAFVLNRQGFGGCCLMYFVAFLVNSKGVGGCFLMIVVAFGLIVAFGKVFEGYVLCFVLAFLLNRQGL